MQDTMTTTKLVALLAELIDERLTSSDCIESLSSCDSGFTLTLTNGQTFNVDVSEG